LSKPDDYWERAGELSYARAMFSSSAVEEHVNRRLWSVALDIADHIGVPASGHVLDLGCGDGAFAIHALTSRFRRVDGYDKAAAAIARANRSAAKQNLSFVVEDLVAMNYAALPRYDAVFMIGLLHHVKAATCDIVKKVAGITEKVIVLEPNGDNLFRKVLEFTPNYRSAGEDSFTTDQLKRIFKDAGFRTAAWRRLNVFPNFTPGFLYRILAPLEELVETNGLLKALCTVNMFGFERAESGEMPSLRGREL
jgi:cyclopropane fatty-acyl-phospholipid synthase-like methyltransferase